MSKILIDYSHSWPSQHLNSIKTAYGSAPYFLYYFDQFAQILKQKHQTLWLLNWQILKNILQILNINPKITLTQKYITTQQAKEQGIIDLRHIANKKSELTIDFPPYPQVFEYKFDFVPNLSILDLLFNLGPESLWYLQNIKLPI